MPTAKAKHLFICRRFYHHGGVPQYIILFI